MAKEELQLIDYYYENKGWELVEDEKRRAESVVAEMAESIYFSSPRQRGQPQQANASAGGDKK